MSQLSSLPITGVRPSEATAATSVGPNDTIFVHTPSGVRLATAAQVASNAPGGNGVTDHGAMQGLSDDDHPQYLNQARGDVRYLASTAAGVSIATLSGGKVPTSQLPDSVLGGLNFQSTWNASTNTPAIPAAAPANKGWYYKVTVAGSSSIDGIAEWAVGDWVVSNGTAWDKVDNTDASQTTDTVTEGAVNLYHTPARVRATPMTGMAASGTALPDANDTVVSAWSKLLGWAGNFAANVRGVALTGWAVGANAAVTAANTLSEAIGLLQGQINALATAMAGKAEVLAEVTLTGATNLTRADHANRTIVYNGPNANLTIQTGAGGGFQASDSLEILTHADSPGVPTLVLPGGATLAGSITRAIGAINRGSDSWVAGTTDPAPGGTMTGPELVTALDTELAGTGWRTVMTPTDIINAVNSVLGTNWQGGTGAAPVITGAVVEDAARNVMVISFSSPLTSANPTGAGGVTLSFTTGSAATVTAVAVSSNTASCTLSRNITADDVFTFSYNGGSSDVPFANASGNTANVTNQAVTNNSLLAGGTPFDLTFGRNTTVNPDDYMMSSRNGNQGSPTETGAVEPSSYEVNNSGTGNFAAVRAMTSLAGLGTNVTITTAEFHMRTAVDGSYIDGTFSVYPSLREWVANQMNYNEWATGQSWETAGAKGAADRGATPLGTLAFTAAQDDTPLVVPLDATAVQNMINAGGDIEMLLFSSGYFAFAVADGYRPYLRLVGTSGA